MTLYDVNFLIFESIPLFIPRICCCFFPFRAGVGLGWVFHQKNPRQNFEGDFKGSSTNLKASQEKEFFQNSQNEIIDRVLFTIIRVLTHLSKSKKVFIHKIEAYVLKLLSANNHCLVISLNNFECLFVDSYFRPNDSNC